MTTNNRSHYIADTSGWIIKRERKAQRNQVHSEEILILENDTFHIDVGGTFCILS